MTVYSTPESSGDRKALGGGAIASLVGLALLLVFVVQNTAFTTIF